MARTGHSKGSVRKGSLVISSMSMWSVCVCLTLLVSVCVCMLVCVCLHLHLYLCLLLWGMHKEYIYIYIWPCLFCILLLELVCDGVHAEVSILCRFTSDLRLRSCLRSCGDHAWEILPGRSCLGDLAWAHMGRMGRARPDFFWRRVAVGWGEGGQ